MVGTLSIQPIGTAAERREFVHFAWQVYQDDPYWVPPLLSERYEFLDPARHPFYRHADVQLFVARRAGKMVGTIAALVNHRHNEFHREEVGFFGLFEVLQDREAAEGLLETAAAWVRERRMTAIRGPANFSGNEEIGLLVDGWNGPPVAMMTYNPRYYVDFIEGAGFVKAQDLLAYMVDLRKFGAEGDSVPAKFAKVSQRVRERRGITTRPINMRDFDAEAERFKKIYNNAWAQNWGFVPVTEEEMDHIAAALKTIIDPDVVWFAEKDGEPVGAMVPIPDLNQALIRAYPRPGVPEWWTMAKLLWYWKVKRVVTTVRGFAGGSLPEYRGVGIEALVFMDSLQAALRKGYISAEVSWILESNTMMRRTAEHYLNGTVYRTYRVYEKAL